MGSRSLRVLLVPLPEPLIFGGRSVGTECVAAAVQHVAREEHLRIDVHVLNDLDWCLHDPSEIAAAIVAESPDLVGFGLYAWNQHAIRKVAGLLRETCPNLPLVGGGPWVTPEAETFLGHNPAFDVLVQGPGEGPFADICRRLEAGARPADLAGIPGTTVRTTDGIRLTPPEAADLGAHPSPYLAGRMPAIHAMLVNVRRGCVNRCAYCGWSSGAVSGPVTPERLAQELAWGLERGVHDVQVIDAAINREISDLELLLQARAMLDSRGLPVDRLSFAGFADVRFLDAERSRLLECCRFSSLEVGLPSVTANSPRSARNAEAFRTFEQALAKLSSEIHVQVDYLLGLPGDDADGFETSLSCLRSIDRPVSEAINVFFPLPGSRVWRDRERQRLVMNEDGPGYVLESATFSASDLRAAATQYVRSSARKAPTDFSTCNPRFPRFGFNSWVDEDAYRMAHERFGDPLPPAPIEPGARFAFHVDLGPLAFLFEGPRWSETAFRSGNLTIRPGRVLWDRATLDVTADDGRRFEVCCQHPTPYHHGGKQTGGANEIWSPPGSGATPGDIATIARSLAERNPAGTPAAPVLVTADGAAPLRIDAARPASRMANGADPPELQGHPLSCATPGTAVPPVVRPTLVGQLRRWADRGEAPLEAGGLTFRPIADSPEEAAFDASDRSGRSFVACVRRANPQHTAFLKACGLDFWYRPGGSLPQSEVEAGLRALANLFLDASRRRLRAAKQARSARPGR